MLPAAPRLRLKAETLVQWLPAAFAWVRNLVLQGPLQRCWTPEQRPILEQLLAGFQQQGGNADALKAHIAQEKIAPTLRDFLEMQRQPRCCRRGGHARRLFLRPGKWRRKYRPSSSSVCRKHSSMMAAKFYGMARPFGRRIVAGDSKGREKSNADCSFRDRSWEE